MAEMKDDGKVRVRCTGCGKRVRYPANQPGATFRCPICHTVMVAPLNGGDDLSLEEESASGVIVGGRSDQVPPQAAPKPPAGTKPAAAPSAPDRAVPALQRVNAFLVRETDRIGRLCEEVVLNTATSVEEQASKLRALRHAKAVYFKRYVEAVMKDLDNEISELHNDPASETATVQNKLKELLQEKRGLMLFLNVMFEIRPGVSPARTGATPDTRGSAAAPPTTPSQRAAQTPQSNPAAGPAPNGKGPGNSGSPSC